MGEAESRPRVERSDSHLVLEFRGTDRFEVIARLGEGGMGVVYRALDRERGETVALKTLRNLDGEGLLRFKNEFRLIQSLDHPNLVSLGELIEADGRWFFTMELVDGTDFYSWVRPPRSDPDGADDTAPGWNWHSGLMPPERDIGRLRAALAQLAQGVAALHHAGFIHRDIKPSNIMVARDGRVVLLDFGFVTHANERSSDRIVGTAAYMSPEQAASMAVGPASDWYSVGAVLYESLAGRPPFDGMPLEVLMAKQSRMPPPPSQVAAEVPPDLEDLCMRLLKVAPSERPDEREILRCLGVQQAPPAQASGSTSISLSSSLFVGRAAELELLDQAYRRCRAGESVAVFVHGESGIGKSALVRAFTRRLTSADDKVLVLASSCYERESVPYKAFDGVADNLSRHLVDIPPVDAAMLLPLHVTHVAEVFPVLRRSPVVVKAMRPSRARLEPAELRARVFAGLREMFIRLTARQPVVVAIEDFQWADADSLALLREVLRPPDAPPLLLITTLRDSHTSAPNTSPVEAIALSGDVHLRLEGLRPEDAREMARVLTRHLAPTMAGTVDTIVGESRGHPLYIDEMVRFGASGGDASAAPKLDSVLWTRIIGLDGPAREILELVAIASAPLEKGTAAATLRQNLSEFTRWVGSLRVAKLVQTTGARKNDRIGVFHDRVRQAVLAHLGPAARREYHERLALALEGQGSAAPEALAIHWGGAGYRDKALEYTREAARQAERALAFERAARLYRRCLDMIEPGSEEALAVRTQLGDALANAGRGAEAANAYLAAASDAKSGAVELYARASGQLLRSGHVDSAIETLRRALEGLDLSMPETPRAALVSLLRQRALIRVRGLGFRERSESENPERALARVDVSWALAVGFGLIDVIRGAEFQARHLRLALATGELGRIARALSVEVGYRYTAGTRGGKAARKVLALAEELTAKLDSPPNLVGLNTLMAGIGAVCEGRWADAEAACRTAEEILREKCSGVAWELSSARIMRLWALWYLGRVGDVADRLPAILHESNERGDLYAVTSCRTYFTPMVHLALDDPERAAAEADRALKRWSQRGFHFQHYFHLFGATQVQLYAGDAEGAYARVLEEWPALKSSLLLSVQQNRVEALHFRARAELAAGAARGDLGLVAEAARRARKIAREKTGWGDGLALLIQAGAHVARGSAGEAGALLERAVESLERSGMQLYVAAARRRLGQLAGPDGAEEVAAADQAMGGLGVKNPAAMTAMLAPGFDR